MEYINIAGENIDFNTSVLKFSLKGLDEIPKEIKLLKNLKILDLSYNEIKEMENLPEGLEILNLDYNKVIDIRNIPINLKILSLMGNKVTKVKILPLRLEKLLIHRNPVNELSRELIKNKHLKIFLYINKDMIIPDSIVNRFFKPLTIPK